MFYEELIFFNFSKLHVKMFQIPTKDPAPGGSAAAKRIHAGPVRLGAIGTIPAVSHAEDVPQHQQHEGLEAFRARQRVPGKQCFALVVRQ